MSRISLGAEALNNLPVLSMAALKSARKNPHVGCLIDRVYPGRPLIISFGFVNWKETPNFDFFGRIKKQELQSGQVFNHLFIRDIHNSWYHRGIPGLGRHVDEAAGTLRGLIRSMGVARVITIGQSMGGYAAIMFGVLLGAERILSFVPLSHLDPDEAIRQGDRRFLRVMHDLRANPPKSLYDDLPRMLKDPSFRGDLHVLYGTHPGHDDGVSSNLDALHAFRIASYKKTFLHPWPASGHTLVKWLIDHGHIDETMSRLLQLDTSDIGDSVPLESPTNAWNSWEAPAWPLAQS